MVICDADERHARATRAVIEGSTLLTLCEHCTTYSPRLANALTRDGWELTPLIEAVVTQPAAQPA